MNNKIVNGLIRSLLLLIISLPCIATTPLQVKYSASTDAYFNKRDEYFVELLELAIKKSNANITLVPVKIADHVDTRDVINLNKGIIDIHWMHTSNQLESKLIPIRIPLDKGLFGWRVMLLDKSNQHMLQNVKNISDLKQYSMVQGYDWPDTSILVASGFKVETSSSFRGRFRMLKHKRGDLFPRSILEVWAEMEEQRNSEIVVDPYILLYYPTAYYFFVAGKNHELQKAIETGLQLTIDDGSFNELFQKYYGEVIKKSKLDSRRIIAIPNPGLPPTTPSHKKELWFSLDDYAAPRNKII